MKNRYILSLDEGTTSARALLYDTKDKKIVSIASQEFKQIYPNPGWVEHDAQEIWHAQLTSMQQAVAYADVDADEIYGVGITNQRETVVMWDSETGRPIHNAICWQCRRTTDFCESLKEKHLGFIRERTGLVVDAYFSGSKIRWLLDNVPESRELLSVGRLRVGTIDTFLIWKLTDGASFVTDSTNASRTMLYNIKTNDWDDELLALLDIPREILPTIVPSSGIVGHTMLLGKPVPIAGIAGDQQAALFGQACFDVGMAKNTYGTGCFILMNIGNEFKLSEDNLVTTVAWNLDGKITYAYEGSIFNAGSSVQWLRDELLLIKHASDTERYALRVPDTNGVYFVPAFTGLGAPYWDMNARGTVCGLTRGTNKHHFVRAVLESMAYSTYDVIHAMEKDVGKIKILRVDGGASNNNFLMQFQADILNVRIERPEITETTGLGAAYLAGLATGAYKSLDDIAKNVSLGRDFVPEMEESIARQKLNGWHKAVKRSLDWDE